MLVLAVSDRCIVNFTNYSFAFTYASYVKTTTTPLTFERWYSLNHEAVMHASFLLYALAIGFRKISIFINIARWFITLEDFKAHMVTAKPIEGSIFLSNQLDEPDKGRSKLRWIKTVLFVVIGAHCLLLLSLAVFGDSMLKVVTIVHYYPMAIGIILCFIWIYWQLHKYIEFICHQPNTSPKQAA